MSLRTPVLRRLVVRAASVIATVLVGLVVGSGVAAQSANSLQSQDPENGATLGSSPTALTFSFNQELDDDHTFTAALACGNQPQQTGLPEVDSEGLVVTVAVPNPLPRGACTIVWELRDGLEQTITSGFSTFSVTSEPGTTVAAGTTDGAQAGTPAPPSPSPNAAVATDGEGSTGGALWLGRLLSTIGILILFGALVLIAVGWPEGPEYVVTVRFLRAMWVLGLVGTVLYLIAYAADHGDTSIGGALSPGAWLDLADDGWRGRGALARLVLVAGSGWVAFRPERIIDPTTQIAAFGIPALAVVAVAMSRVAGSAALLGFVVGAAHVLAVAVWIGGVALVARVVLAGPGEDDLVQATRAFSRISVPAILVTAITGIIQMIRLVGNSLFSSGHGQVLLLKVIAVAVMVAVALAVRQQVTLRLERAHEMTVPLADRFRRAFGAEAALGIVVLAFSGWLLALTPARIDPLAGTDYAIEIPFVDASSGLEARVLIDPARVGLNALRVDVDAPADGITNLVLRFIPPEGAAALLVEQPIPLSTAGTAILDESVGIPFQAPGTWTLELSASTAIGVQEGAIRTFLVTNADGSIETIPPADSTVPVETVLIDQSTTTAPLATSPTTAPPPPSAPTTAGAGG